MHLLSFFSSLYEWCIGRNDDPIYKDEVFFSVGLFTVLIAATFCVIFYVGLGRWKPFFYQLSHWIITIIVVAVVSGFLALQQSKGATQSTDFDAYMIRFSLFNALISAIYFFLLSILFKRASIFARRTPF